MKSVFIVILCFTLGLALSLGVRYLFALAGAPQSVWLMETLGIM